MSVAGVEAVDNQIVVTEGRRAELRPLMVSSVGWKPEQKSES